MTRRQWKQIALILAFPIYGIALIASANAELLEPMTIASSGIVVLFGLLRGPWAAVLATPVLLGENAAIGMVIRGQEATIAQLLDVTFWLGHGAAMVCGVVVGRLQQLSARLRIEIRDRSHAEEQLTQAQKMEALGTLAGGIAHDMNNVLAVVLGLSSVLEKEMRPADPKSHTVQEIMSAARRGKSLVENLLGFARKGKYQKDRVSLNDAVCKLVEMLGHSIPKNVAPREGAEHRRDDLEGSVGRGAQAV